MKYYNNNPAFGNSGPFYADNKEELADDLAEQIEDWSIDRARWDREIARRDGDTKYLEKWSHKKLVEYHRATKRAEFIAALEDVTEEVIFDNAGGVTLQLHGYCHHYADPIQAAEDVKVWLDTQSVDDWDGHEPESACNPTPEQIRNGGYRIWIIGDDYGVNYSWGNMTDFFKALDRG